MTTALLIRDVALVDVVQGRVHGPRSVVIEDGLIRDIVAAGASLVRAKPRRERTLPGTGAD